MFNFQTKLNNSPGAAGHLTAEEFNNFIRELENVVTFGKLILSEDPAHVTQIAQALAIAARSASIFNDVGSANQVRLTPHAGANTFPLPPNYTGLDGNAVTFRVSFANTGATTLDLGMTVGVMLGARGLVRPDGAALQAGDLQPGGYVTAIYDAAIDKWRLAHWGYASEQDFEDHVQDFSNPHQVSLAQLGGASNAALQAHIGDTNNPHQVTLGQLGGAPLDSPAFTGSPSAPTPAPGDNDSSIATTAFVQAAVASGSGYTSSLGAIGWRRSSDGFIEQWGRIQSVRSEGTGPSITFPIAFPNACLNVVLGEWNRTGGGASQWQQIDCFAQVTGDPSTTGFGTFIQDPGGAGNVWEGCFWRAIGY